MDQWDSGIVRRPLAAVHCSSVAFGLLSFTDEARLLRFEAPKGAFLICAREGATTPLSPKGAVKPKNLPAGRPVKLKNLHARQGVSKGAASRLLLTIPS